MKIPTVIATIAFSLLLTTAAMAAEPAIAVLNFELNDLTIHTDNHAEQARTATIAGLLQAALREQHNYPIAEIPDSVQAAADRGFGYLYSHHDLAAELGRTHQARWIVVGRLHKPSYLFAYLKAQVVDTDTGKRIADLVVEIKGSSEKLTRRGVDNLAEQIAAALPRRHPG